MEQAKNLGIMTAAEPTNDDGNGEEKIFNFGVYKYGRDKTSLSRRILQVCNVFLLVESCFLEILRAH